MVPFKWAWLVGIFFFFSFCMESPVGILVPLHNGSIYEGMLGRNLEKIKGAKSKHTHTHTHNFWRLQSLYQSTNCWSGLKQMQQSCQDSSTHTQSERVLLTPKKKNKSRISKPSCKVWYARRVQLGAVLVGNLLQLGTTLQAIIIGGSTIWCRCV